MDLTPNEEKVMSFLRSTLLIYRTAEVIGFGAGGTEYGCGSWAVETCASLFAKGLLNRSSNGWYRPKCPD